VTSATTDGRGEFAIDARGNRGILVAGGLGEEEDWVEGWKPVRLTGLDQDDEAEVVCAGEGGVRVAFVDSGGCGVPGLRVELRDSRGRRLPSRGASLGPDGARIADRRHDSSLFARANSLTDGSGVFFRGGLPRGEYGVVVWDGPRPTSVRVEPIRVVGGRVSHRVVVVPDL
jgi:hypothetical protein